MRYRSGKIEYKKNGYVNDVKRLDEDQNIIFQG